ncbi:prolyl oligopeptidase family serine peptidase, partial [Acidobacteriota bacterium]
LKFKFFLLPVEAEVTVIEKDIERPDLVKGERLSSWIGIPLINTTMCPMKNIEVIAGDGRAFLKRRIQIPYLAPLSVIKQPVRFEFDGTSGEIKLDDKGRVSLPITVATRSSSHGILIPLQLREPDEAASRVFISPVDRSVQHYSVLPPKEYDAAGTYGLILSLHGAGVKSLGQVKAYRPKARAFVVAPTNRRPFGFDWQDWGRLNALAALKEVLTRYPIDPDRIYLTGHSMGGHGTWHVGLLHPGLFAALAPSAGWTDFHLYSPRFLRRSALYAHPQLAAIHEMALLGDRTPLFASNAASLPVFVLHGGADDNVPPTHGRRMAGILRSLGADPVYTEVPEKGHWWDDEVKDNGTACVDLDDLMTFLQTKERANPQRTVHHRTVNPDQNGKNRWIEVLSLVRPYFPGEVKAASDNGGTVTLDLTNIEILRLIPEDSWKAKVHVIANGKALPPRKRTRSLIIARSGDGYRWAEPDAKSLKKRPGLYGPIKAAYFKPFLFVYGTEGDSDRTALNLEIARNLAQKWWIRGNGYVQVLPDSLVSEGDIEKFNLILFGNEETNNLTRRIGPSLPIRVTHGAVRLKGRQYNGSGIAAKFVYPNPLFPDRLVLVWAGTDAEGMALTTAMDTLYSGAGLPDFLIWNRDVKRKGWGGVIAAGFFDNRWQLARDLSFFGDIPLP